MKTVNDYTVIIAGAGPTGLMLACELQLAGVKVAIIERRSHGTTGESRAPGINARTMEIFRMRGLAEEFERIGVALPAVLFSGIPMQPKVQDPGWPNALILPQHQTERLLARRALELGVDIHWSADLIYFRQDEEQVNIVVQQKGIVKEFSARYLAGCDGGSSTVRRLCGELFTGDDPVSHWLVADVELDQPPAGGAVFGRNLRIGTYQVSNVEKDWFRVSLMTVNPPKDRNAPVTLEELRQAMTEGIGSDFGLRGARWMSRFGDGFRQVTKYRFERVFLLGDAAHTHSPIGGQGLNLGIQDAVNLGWKLARVVNGQASDTLLDTFNEERHPVGATVLQMAKAQTALIKPGAQIEALREVMAAMLKVPEVVMDLSKTLSGLGVRYAWGEGCHPLVGRRVPDFSMEVYATTTGLFSLMHSGRPLLLNFDAQNQIALPEAYRSAIDIIHAVPCVNGDTFTWKIPVLGNIPALANIFVRPDGVVAWAQSVSEPYNSGTLNEVLKIWLG